MDLVRLAADWGIESTVTSQGGLIRRDQAIAAGLGRAALENRVRRGRWIRVLPRVYAVDVDPAAPRVRIRAGWLWAGTDCVVAGAAAAFWNGFAPPPAVVDLYVPSHRRLAPQAGWAVHGIDVDDRDWRWRDDLKVTAVARTVLDLARAGATHHGHDALRRRMVTPARLIQTLDRGGGSRGQVAARAAVASLAGNPWSVAEGRAHELLRLAGITGWVANLSVVVGRRTLILDIAIEQVKLAIEIDGREHHDNPAAFESDRERQNLLVAAGWTVLRFTWRQLCDQPDVVMATIRATLARLCSPPRRA